MEVAPLPIGVALRDSTDPDGPTLRFSGGDWTSFITAIRAEIL